MSLSNYLENALINATLRGQSYTPPTTIYVALFTDDPTDADSGTEISASKYERQAVTFEAPTNGETSNNADILFPTAEVDWGTVTHIGLYDAKTGGNLLYHSILDQQKDIVAYTQFKFPTNYLVVRLK